MVYWVDLPHNQTESKLYKAFVKNELKVFRRMLIEHIPVLKLNRTERGLINTPIIQFTEDLSLRKICILFANSLKFTVMEETGVCGYKLDPYIKCPYTNRSFDFVIRLIENGNNSVPPMHWITPTFNSFITEIRYRWELYRKSIVTRRV